MSSPSPTSPASSTSSVLTVAHCRAFAAWLLHGPGTVRQVSGKADLPMIDLHPRTQELLAIGAVHAVGNSETEGPLYAAVTADMDTPSATDLVERRLTTLPIQDQVSIAAGIMAKYGRRGKALRDGTGQQSALSL